MQYDQNKPDNEQSNKNAIQTVFPQLSQLELQQAHLLSRCTGTISHIQNFMSKINEKLQEGYTKYLRTKISKVG